MLNPRNPIGPGYTNTIAWLNRAPGQIQEWKESCARGGARVALTLLACHQPDANLWRITKGFPKTDCEGNLVDRTEAWRVVSGYATKVARLVDCDRRYKEADEPTKLEDEPSSEDEEAAISEGQAEADPAASPAPEAASLPLAV
jgi:hypothetical protein